MIAIHHGPPGSFKSFSVVQNILVPALLGYDPNVKQSKFTSVNLFNKNKSTELQGRVVVTNMRGFTIESIEKALDVKVHPNSELITMPMTEDGFEKMARFWHWVPIGALIVMDEAPDIYPASWGESDFNKLEYSDYIEGDETSRPRTLKRAFNMHRHFGWDIYLTATHIDKVHKQVKQNCEYAIRHKNLTGILPFMKNTWKEVKHSPANSGLSLSNHLEQPEQNKANAKYFNAYKSTAIGQPKNSHGNSNLLLQPKLVFFYGLIAVSFVLLYNFSSSSSLFNFGETPKAIVQTNQKNINIPANSNHRQPFTESPTASNTSKLSFLKEIFSKKLYNVGNFGSTFHFVDDTGATYTSSLFKQLGAKFEVLSGKQSSEPLVHLFKISFADQEYLITRDYRQHREVDYEYVQPNNSESTQAVSSIVSAPDLPISFTN